MRRVHPWLLVATWLVTGGLLGFRVTPALAQAPPALAPGPPARPLIGEVLIFVHPVFESGRALLYRAANALHIRTRESVVRRELLFAPGQPVVPRLVRETERNLRALDFIAEAWIEEHPRPDGHVDLHVHTRDRFSLSADLSVDAQDNDPEFRVGLGEKNLLGRGLTLRGALTRREDGETIQRFDFSDPRWLGSRHQLDLDGSHNSEKGDRFRASLVRPFYSLDTRWSWGAQLARERGETTYYEGSTESSVEHELLFVGGHAIRAFGSPRRRTLLGLETTFDAREYGDAEGPRAAALRIPERSESVLVVARLGHEHIIEFQERRYLDALGATEDVRLGLSGELHAGPVFRREHGDRARASGLVRARGQVVLEPWASHLSVLRAESEGRFRAGQARAYQGLVLYHHYYQWAESQTLAASVAYDAIFESENLEAELYLGRESGLRGYDPREFDGQKRLRLNLEQRFLLPWETYQFRFSLVPFVDAGAVWKRGEDLALNDLRPGVGLGLRIGSVPLMGRRVARIDIAVPLGPDRRGERQTGVTVLFTFGQVFSLLNNAERLERDF